MDYASSRELKNIARDKMLGQYGTAIGAFLFMRVILIMLLGMCSSIFGQHRVMMMIAAFIITLFEGIFTYGELSIYLKIAVGMPTQSMDVFSAFRNSAVRAIKARLILVAIVYGGLYIFLGIDYLTDMMQASIGKAIDAVFGTVILIICIYLLLTYSQVMYFMQDFASISVKEACIRSRNLMQGNKLTLLLTYLSFIPIYIVGVLSFMVGVYFIHPYVKMTLTEFYLDRVKKTTKEGGSGL